MKGMNVLRGMFELHYLSEAIDRKPCFTVDNRRCDPVITKALWFDQTERDWWLKLPEPVENLFDRKLFRHQWIRHEPINIQPVFPIINCGNYILIQPKQIF